MTDVPTTLPQPPAADISGATDDEQPVDAWLRGRPNTTRRVYARDARRFLADVGKPLGRLQVVDVQRFAERLSGSSATRARTISAIKSLLTWAYRVGYLRHNVGVPVRTPSIKDTLGERILTEAEVQRLMALELRRRNRVMLALLYGAGLRVTELSELRWRDVQSRGDSGQIVVQGKDGKTRAVLLSTSLWCNLCELRGSAAPGDAVFASRKKRRDGERRLSVYGVYMVVRRAAERAGLDAPVSPHWLRHAHASHALDRGCPIHLVQATLGHATVATTGRYLHARPNDSSARYLAV